VSHAVPPRYDSSDPPCQRCRRLQPRTKRSSPLKNTSIPHRALRRAGRRSYVTHTDAPARYAIHGVSAADSRRQPGRRLCRRLWRSSESGNQGKLSIGNYLAGETTTLVGGWRARGDRRGNARGRGTSEGLICNAYTFPPRPGEIRRNSAKSPSRWPRTPILDSEAKAANLRDRLQCENPLTTQADEERQQAGKRRDCATVAPGLDGASATAEHSTGTGNALGPHSVTKNKSTARPLVSTAIPGSVFRNSRRAASVSTFHRNIRSPTRQARGT